MGSVDGVQRIIKPNYQTLSIHRCLIANVAVLDWQSVDCPRLFSTGKGSTAHDSVVEGSCVNFDRIKIESSRIFFSSHQVTSLLPTVENAGGRTRYHALHLLTGKGLYIGVKADPQQAMGRGLRKKRPSGRFVDSIMYATSLDAS
ncbi:hypothetical protein K2173_015864 [Erythroxylum novogranatense]|uniref:Uncharacterized protein n=1 Tax=Erythroxylum novogranatense TaxID=1862640 RepID=A0AAV8SF59_9ROSI|nr:hypothetical protein K2173_015864 [Erythroxylum novogranatense]